MVVCRCEVSRFIDYGTPSALLWDGCNAEKEVVNNRQKSSASAKPRLAFLLGISLVALLFEKGFRRHCDNEDNCIAELLYAMKPSNGALVLCRCRGLLPIIGSSTRKTIQLVAVTGSDGLITLLLASWT